MRLSFSAMSPASFSIAVGFRHRNSAEDRSEFDERSNSARLAGLASKIRSPRDGIVSQNSPRAQRCIPSHLLPPLGGDAP